MAAEVTDKQFKALVAEVKKNPGNSERHYAEVTGIPMGQIGKALYQAEVEADPKLKIAATPKAVTDAVNRGTLRWPRIAAYAGITVGQAKKLYEEHTGKTAPSNVTSRGRKFDDNGSAPAKSQSGGSGRAQGKSGTSGRRTGVQVVASGRRGANKSQTAASSNKPAAGRRGTRASAGSSPK